MVASQFVGRTWTPVAPYEIGVEKVREFANAVGATSAVHHDVAAARAAGHASLVAPFTFAAIIAQRAEFAYCSMPEAEIDFSRVVHATERITLTAPLVAGTAVAASLLVESIVERAGTAFVTTRTDLTDADAGTQLGSVTSTLAVRGEA